MAEPSFLLPLYHFAIVPHFQDQLTALAALAEPEDWNYKNTKSDHELPILYNYVHRTFQRIEEQEKVAESTDQEHALLDTGLVTPYQEPIYMLFDTNLMRKEASEPAWHFRRFCRKGERELNNFPQLPEMATYFEDPSCLVFNAKLDLRVNIQHIIVANKSRFPKPHCNMPEYQLQNAIKGAVESAKERVKRSYKAAVPQFYRGNIQLLLPLCLKTPNIADLALVVEEGEGFYRASTCLTLDMAYNNARQLARPNREWLQP